MRAGWVAGAARGRALLRRRLGASAVTVARAPGLVAALPILAASSYGARLPTGGGVSEVQRSIFTTLLWHLRVLAGWLPPGGAELLRVAAAPFEIANVEDRLARLRGAASAEPFALGSLATAWPAMAGALSAAELRERLARSPWGDPGSEELPDVRAAMLTSWARRTEHEAPEAAPWVAEAVALQHDLNAPTATAGPTADAAWQAELAWWRRVDVEADRLARDPRRHRAVIVGCAALLGVDAWRTAIALEGAVRGGSTEVAERLAWA